MSEYSAFTMPTNVVFSLPCKKKKTTTNFVFLLIIYHIYTDEWGSKKK